MIPTKIHAIFGSEIHAMLVWKTLFRRPNCVLYIHFQTMATAAGAQTIGRKKMVRYTERPAHFLFRRTARISAMTMPNGTSISAYLIVFQKDCHVSAACVTV